MESPVVPDIHILFSEALSRTAPPKASGDVMLPVRSRFLPLKQLKASLFFQRHHAPTDSRQRISQLFCRNRAARFRGHRCCTLDPGCFHFLQSTAGSPLCGIFSRWNRRCCQSHCTDTVLCRFPVYCLSVSLPPGISVPKKDCILRLSMIYTPLKCSLITSLHQASLYIGYLMRHQR